MNQREHAVSEVLDGQDAHVLAVEPLRLLEIKA